MTSKSIKNNKIKSKSKKVSSKKKSSHSKKRNNDGELKTEIISIVSIGINVLLVISVYTKNGAGMVGYFLSSVLKGLFGLGAYFLPILIIIFCLYLLFDENKFVNVFKLLMSFILFLLIISLAHLFGNKSGISFSDFSQYLKGNFNNGSISNGGVIGALIGDGMIKILGRFGTYIALFTLIIILLILLTGKSFFKFITELYEKYSDTFFSDEDEDAYDDDYEEDEEDIEETKDEEDKPDEKSNPLESSPKIKEINFKYPLKKNTRYVRKQEKKVVTIDIKKDDLKSEKRKISLFTEEIRKKREQENIPSFLKEKMKQSEDNNFEENNNFTLENFSEIKYDIGNKSRANILYVEPEFTGIKEDDNIRIIESDNNITKDDVINFKPIEQKAKHVASNLISSIENKDIIKQEPIIIQAENKSILNIEEIDSKESDFKYEFPKLSFLKRNPIRQTQNSKIEILENARILEETLKSFGVEAKVIEISKGPTVTRYELSPGVGVKVSKILGLSDDLALGLAASGIRIEAPIPGKAAVGIEIPNKEILNVYLSEVICNNTFQNFESKLAFGLGKDIAGNVIVADIAKMPHMLIAGATGSGKSVCINTLITSILYKASPEEVKLIMVDPKVVELSVYNGIPHLLIPVVTDPKKASGALNWAVQEMMVRYQLFAQTGTRNLTGYNKIKKENDEKTIPQIVIIIDELADLMMVASKEVESSICRLAQLARAAGIHLIIATQRPSVDVITGLIKANIPSRIAFAVSSGTDSRTIIDTVGAEKLLGKGDMLFKAVDMNKPLRVQGAFVSDKEVETIVKFIAENNPADYDEKMIEKITKASSALEKESNSDSSDELTDDAISFIVKKGKASVSMLQRQFRIGYNRAARIMEELEERGIVGPEDGSKPRAVLMDKYEWQDYSERHSDF